MNIIMSLDIKFVKKSYIREKIIDRYQVYNWQVHPKHNIRGNVGLNEEN